MASSIGAVYGKCSSNFVLARDVLPLLGQRVVWYSLTQWLPPTTKDTNHVLLPSKDRYRPSPQPWNASPSKTMTWRSKYAKGMHDPAIIGTSKNILALKKRTKRDPKEATPQAEKSDKTVAIHPSRKRHHRTWL